MQIILKHLNGIQCFICTFRAIAHPGTCHETTVGAYQHLKCLNCSRVATGDSNGNGQDDVVTIDAGDKIWSMAFGLRGTNGKQKSNPSAFRYLVVDDVILATGLRNGRIRTWDVKTGTFPRYRF